MIGLFPTLGSLVKGVLKLFFVFIRRHGLEHMIRAVEEGMTWVVTYLRKREVQRYISTRHIDEVFKWLADQIREVRGKLSAPALLKNFDRGIALMKDLLAKVDWMPGKIGDAARASIVRVEAIRRRAGPVAAGPARRRPGAPRAAGGSHFEAVFRGGRPTPSCAGNGRVPTRVAVSPPRCGRVGPCGRGRAWPPPPRAPRHTCAC